MASHHQPHRMINERNQHVQSEAVNIGSESKTTLSRRHSGKPAMLSEFHQQRQQMRDQDRIEREQRSLSVSAVSGPLTANLAPVRFQYGEPNRSSPAPARRPSHLEQVNGTYDNRRNAMPVWESCRCERVFADGTTLSGPLQASVPAYPKQGG